MTKDRDNNVTGGRRPQTTLVMFSGGIDSTYSLVKLLRETDDEVLVHHIHLVNVEQRHRVEAQRCRKIVDYCKHEFRDVSYSESAIDHRGLRFFGYDMITVGFEAGVVAHSYRLAPDRMIDRWTIGTCSEEGHWEERFAHVEACCRANCFPHSPPQFFLYPLLPKREEMAYLPTEILNLTWTCRRPVPIDGKFQECGECMTCVLMQEVRDQRAENPELVEEL